MQHAILTLFGQPQKNNFTQLQAGKNQHVQFNIKSWHSWSIIIVLVITCIETELKINNKGPVVYGAVYDSMVLAPKRPLGMHREE